MVQRLRNEIESVKKQVGGGWSCRAATACGGQAGGDGGQAQPKEPGPGIGAGLEGQAFPLR